MSILHHHNTVTDNPDAMVFKTYDGLDGIMYSELQAIWLYLCSYIHQLAKLRAFPKDLSEVWIWAA